MFLEKLSLTRCPEVCINQFDIVGQGMGGDERFDALIVRSQRQLGKQIVDGSCGRFHVISSTRGIPVFISPLWE
ncbi:6-phosphofructokinase [Pseudomonas syringae pv. actinidiae]|uniref:6-phosphofructokinase n=1 Tax=Pseudomonas syringae pv. actinidiae TaxID=103796 RepID=A0AAN4TKS2_PSESF|nr:6-phosphofructokinase [Pseudomonas syringae pv. actinidiae]